ncbi:hypothetical protein H6776_02585 [Candidatus Nomurabacteria bacterium]|nr:hypothetical protein [Candidatus Nomurabacteria bacterium]
MKTLVVIVCFIITFSAKATMPAGKEFSISKNYKIIMQDDGKVFLVGKEAFEEIIPPSKEDWDTFAQSLTVETISIPEKQKIFNILNDHRVKVKYKGEAIKVIFRNENYGKIMLTYTARGECCMEILKDLRLY